MKELQKNLQEKTALDACILAICRKVLAWLFHLYNPIGKIKVFAAQQGLSIAIDDIRRHHEIYLSDPRKTATDKLKTVIRYPVK